MLRVKEPYIDELHQAILHWIRQYNENEIIDTISEGFLRFQKASEVILQDVRSDICRLDTILETFQQFRLRNVQKYQTAFIDMSLPKIIGPFVVLDLVLCLFDFLTEGYPKVFTAVRFLFS